MKSVILFALGDEIHPQRHCAKKAKIKSHLQSWRSTNYTNQDKKQKEKQNDIPACTQYTVKSPCYKQKH